MFILCVVTSALMYGYAVSGAEDVGSLVANATGYPVPEGFKLSLIPSLLFGSLISATDPGVCVCVVCTVMPWNLF